MRNPLVVFAAGLLALLSFAGQAGEVWLERSAEGQPALQLYFFWSLTCPHCTEARPDVEAIPLDRPWVKLHSLELTRNPDNVHLYQAMAEQLGEEAAGGLAVLVGALNLKDFSVSARGLRCPSRRRRSLTCFAGHATSSVPGTCRPCCWPRCSWRSPPTSMSCSARPACPWSTPVC